MRTDQGAGRVEGGPAVVGCRRAVGGSLAEVVLGALARAVLLQVARHVLARQAHGDGAHVLQDLRGDRLVSAQRLHGIHKALMQLLGPLHLAVAPHVSEGVASGLPRLSISPPDSTSPASCEGQAQHPAFSVLSNR